MSADESAAPRDPIGFLDYYLVQKAPFQIPAGAREWIVRYGPWITLVVLVISLPPLLFALGIGAIVAPFAGVGYATGFTYLTVVLIVQLGLMLMALPGLFARKMSAWRLLYYSQLIGLASGLLQGSVVSPLVAALIGFYILFQVRTLYSD